MKHAKRITVDVNYQSPRSERDAPVTGDSAFRRLLLDTVATTISQPPSASSLVELLRIATPGLLASPTNKNQRRRAEARARHASQRERLFRTLQLRIHPDKHDGDDRAKELFQEVTLFYGKCLQEMEKEDTRRRSSNGVNDTSRHDLYKASRREPAIPSSGSDESGCSVATEPVHSDYESFDCEYEQQRHYHQPDVDLRWGGHQPPSHCFYATIGAVVCPPLGLCALCHSLKVGRAWGEGRRDDAHNHSDKAFFYSLLSCLSVPPFILFIWMGGTIYYSVLPSLQ